MVKPPTDVREQNIQLSHPHPYFFTLTHEGCDAHLWKIQSTSLVHIVSFPSNIYPGQTILVDPSKHVVIVHHGTILMFYSLKDGNSIREISLCDDMQRVESIQYLHERVLATVVDADQTSRPRVYTSIAYNIFDSGSPVAHRTVRWPTSEGEYSFESLLLFEDDGIVAKSLIDPTGKSNAANLHYSPPDQPNSSPTPSSIKSLRLDPPENDKVPNFIYDITQATSIGQDRFVVCLLERGVQPDGPYTYRCTLRAYSVPSLEAVWTAESIWGQIKNVRFLPETNVVVATGTIAQRAPYEDYAHFVLALDAQTGELVQSGYVSHDKQGDSISACAVVDGVDESDASGSHIVLVWRRGSINMIPLQDFLKEGLPKESTGVLRPSYGWGG